MQQQQPICHIVGAGPFCARAPRIQPGDLVIAADGGYAHLCRWGLEADIVIGDFDSGEEPLHPHVLRLPREKDVTDTLAAVELGRQRGYGCFRIYCGLGALLDHTLANVQLLSGLAEAGERGFLLDDEIAVCAIENGALDLPAGLEGRVSVFAQGGKARGVTLSGLKYALQDAELSDTFALGVSNEIHGEPARISVARGRLLIICPRPQDM